MRRRSSLYLGDIDLSERHTMWFMKHYAEYYDNCCNKEVVNIWRRVDRKKSLNVLYRLLLVVSKRDSK